MNGDGLKDMITGHYWPGDIHYFERRTDGSFGQLSYLKDETGRNLNAGLPWDDENTPRMESLAAAPWATDFDGDGDFDMLIGNIVGEVILVENVGTKRKPLFSKGRTKLTAGGVPIKVGGGDSGPVHADWNGDGLRDLVIGAGDGSVVWCQNTGSETKPDFASPETLVVAPPEEASYEPYPHGTLPKRPGIRTKVCVADYDADGRVDLLVGDFASEGGVEPELTSEQVAERDSLRAEREAIEAEIQTYFDGLEDEADLDEAVLQAMSERMGKVYEALAGLEKRDTPVGHVWFYKRLAPEVEAIPAGAKGQ